MKNLVAVVLAALLLSLPVTAFAHEGHTHKVLGTVTDIDFPHLEVTTTDKKSVTIMLDGATVITRGKTKVKDIDIKVGDRISAETNEKGGMMMVKTLKVGVAPAK